MGDKAQAVHRRRLTGSWLAGWWGLGASFLQHETRHNVHALQLLEEQLAGIGDPARQKGGQLEWAQCS